MSFSLTADIVVRFPPSRTVMAVMAFNFKTNVYYLMVDLHLTLYLKDAKGYSFNSLLQGCPFHRN